MLNPLSTIDNNLQVLSGVNSSWDMPPMPNETMLDLATIAPDTKTLSSFVWGLNQDLMSNTPISQATTTTPWQYQPTTGENINSFFGGITSADQTAKLDPYAVQNMKQQLVDNGYLDLTPAEIASPVWLPEYGIASRQMAIDQSNARFQGDKPGAITAKKALETAGQLTAPSILMTAATHLGLWWDFKTMGEEAKSFGDNFKSWIEDPFNIHKFGQAFSLVFDAVTPIINWGLLFSGVGDVWLTGKALWAGKTLAEGAGLAVDVAEGAKVAQSALEGSKFLQFGQSFRPFSSALGKGGIEGSIGRLGERGIGRSLLLGREGTLAGEPNAIGRALEGFRSRESVKSIGNTLEAWSKRRDVMMARKLTQFGMRMGLASNLEGMAGIHTQAVPGISTVGDWINNQATRHPLTAAVLDMSLLPVTPIHMLSEGTFTEAGRTALNLTKRSIYRVGNMSAPTESTSLLMSVDKAVRSAAAPDVLATYDTAVKERGMQQAVTELFGAGSQDAADKALSEFVVGSVIDAYSQEMAGFGGSTMKDLMRAQLKKFAVRRRLHAMLRTMDIHDVNGIADRMVLGVSPQADAAATLDDLVTQKSWSPSVVRRRAEEFKDTFRETADQAAARGGAAHPEDIRVYVSGEGEMTLMSTDLSRLPAEEDPRFFDVNVQELADMTGMTRTQAAGALHDMNPIATDDNVMRRAAVQLGDRYFQPASEDAAGTWRYARLSEADQVRRFDPQLIKERLSAIAEKHNGMRQATLTELMSRADDRAVSTFMAQHIATIGDSHNYAHASGVLAEAQLNGHLANTVYAPVTSATGRQLSNLVGQSVDWDKAASYGLWEYYKGLAFNNDYMQSLHRTTFAPLGRQIDPTGYGFVLGRLDQASKQESLMPVALADYYLNLQKDVARVLDPAGNVAGEGSRIVQTVGQLASEQGLRDITELGGSKLTHAVDIAAEAHGMAGMTKTKDAIRRLVRYAQDRNISFDEVSQMLQSDIEALARDESWQRVYRAPAVLDYTSMEDLLQQNRDNLFKLAQLRASEVTGIPEEVRLAAAADGYRIMHGVDFMAPNDINDLLPAFQDVTKAQIRAAKFERFFQRQAPVERQMANTRALRQGLWSALVERSADPTRNIRLTMGQSPYEDLPDLRRLMSNLREMKENLVHQADSELRSAEHASAFGKGVTRVKLAYTPRSVSDLATQHWKNYFFQEMDKLNYTPDEARAIFDGLHRARDTGFDHLGLVEIEAKLRSQPNVVNGLRYLGKHAASDRLGPVSKIGVHTGQFLSGAAVSSLAVGANRERNQRPDTLTDWIARVTGFAVGMAGANAVGERLGLLERTGTGVAASAARALENSTSLMPYTYMADNLAHIRDIFRFSLSPIFDASRFTKATLLAQVEELPPGVKMAFNQSPKAFRRAIARELVAGGASKEAATAEAAARWDRARSEFISAARGDFDFEQIESIGGYFNQMGVLGFSPQEWMASTFGNLRQAGVDPEKAYELARNIYTYGINGRSAAEMSVNFIFFPFSFEKKVVSHMWDFMQSDLGRTVMLHDGLKMYEALDDQYNLSEWANDHLPALEKMYRLNVFSHGFSLGEFGGINAPILQGLKGMPVVGNIFGVPGRAADFAAGAFGLDSVKNLFVPQAVSIGNPGDAADVMLAFKRILPAIGDLSSLWADAKQQGHVIFSQSHLTTDAETQAGWDAWRSWQDALVAEAGKGGATWHDMMSGTSASAQYFQQLAQQKRAEIANQFPSWVLDFGDGVSSKVSLTQELQQRLMSPKPKYGDEQLAQFYNIFQSYQQQLSAAGYTWQEPERMPPEAFEYLRQQAITLAKQNKAFVPLYNRFYRRLLGDITTELS